MAWIQRAKANIHVFTVGSKRVAEVCVVLSAFLFCLSPAIAQPTYTLIAVDELRGVAVFIQEDRSSLARIGQKLDQGFVLKKIDSKGVEVSYQDASGFSKSFILKEGQDLYQILAKIKKDADILLDVSKTVVVEINQ
ncbi:hypothetical protein E8K88_16275 [Lampropedia aestuarii]|uniref:Uncharacterized protein n=1 Tax=Lampropedia aestuarii TaxID=2562762 RepID=A0A4S5BK35_9BURK|nr:hypothetical protein [Lampropedia aestuarii]THJ31021.1 hypothetical protein E8K88_16275 [Lampropedia aestuarii]